MVTDPDYCKKVHLTYMGQIATPYQCMSRGQPEMAKWSLKNPNWTIKKWRCGNVDLAKKEA